MIVFFATVANFLSGVYFTSSNLKKTLEQDLAFAIGIADNLVSTNMSLIKTEAAIVAGRLSRSGSDADLMPRMKEIIASQISGLPDITALSVFDRKGVIASYCVPAHVHDLTMHGGYIEMVYNGATIISSPFYCSTRGEFIINVYTPIEPDRILAVTIPGLIFTDMLSNHRLWQTGNVFMLNEDGTVIGAANPEIVLAASNLEGVEVSGAGDNVREVDQLVQTILSTESGVIGYRSGGINHLCAYSLIDSSLLGWRVAVTVPFSESPHAESLDEHFYTALFFLIVGAVMAFFLSRLTTRPFDKIEAQKCDLEKLNETIQAQADSLEIALAAAQEANNAKSSFLAQMSHEIRTPLNTVVGLSELMLYNDKPGSESEVNLEKIHTSGMTILSIVNDILDISKIESGKFEIFPVRYDTPSLINDIVTLNIVRIEEKAITFKLYVDENLPGVFLGDDLRVKQIFNNLLSNAFKYTQAGTVEWRVTFERDGEEMWLVSSVRDTGIGIKEEDIDKLFSDYKQVNLQTNRKIGGTGLGLAITKRLTEMMDGSIFVESEYGKGSTFHVRLRQGFVSETPIGKTVAENLMSLRYTLSKRARNTKVSRINLSYAHVLVVDDIVTNLDVVKGMLKPYGLKVDCATNGRQAIDMVRSGNPRYSAIFMDHMMPGMDGIEASRIIRELGTEYARDVPIIALTANAIVGNEEMFLNQGFQAFISKPIEMMKLDAALRRWVRDKSYEKDMGEEFAEVFGDGGEAVSGAIVIDGIDTRRALERFGGNDEIFIDVLRSYAVNTRPLLENMDRFLEVENLADYGIVAHGIKGSSYSIVAQAVGKLAEELEHAAKAGDIESVRRAHGEFRTAAETLLAGIDAALERAGEGAGKPAADYPDEGVLAELRAACEAFDMDRVDRAMGQLEMYRYERGGRLVEWLREQVNNMMFEEISGGEWPSG